MTELPTGTVTFLFTDLEGSTRLWEEHPEAMKAALARHDEILRDAVEQRDGHVVKTTGDGLHAVFAMAPDAVAAAVDAQRTLTQEAWALPEPLKVRMGLHSGGAELRDGDYYGTAVNRAARVSAAAHGGQIVASAATADLVRDDLEAEVALVDLGEHRLRDLARAERIVQLTHPDLPGDFPPLRSLDAYPGNLPVQRTAFVGRADDLTNVRDALDDSPLVTLTGVGGVGKTRLALQVAADAVPRFPDGTWFVDLGPVLDAGFVASAFSTSLALPERRQGTLEDSVVAGLRDKRLLVVLDNCEHVIDTVAGLIDAIVESCPGVTVLATSREALGIEGEDTYEVRPLGRSAADAPADAESLIDDDAVRLFAERARAAKRGFTLSTENVPIVAEICRRLDGIPLAIELAAARLRLMAPDEVLARLDERFELLAGGRRTVLERHQTLRGAIDWSYTLLDPAEQLLFTRLSVFAGGFTLDAAEAVGSGDDLEERRVLPLLGSLVAKSMVVTDDTDAGTRYRLLDTLREYANERLVELDEPDRVRAGHAEHFLALVETAGPMIKGGGDSDAWTRLAADQDNLRAALSWTRDHGDDDRFVRLVRQLSLYWYMTLNYRENYQWNRDALERASAFPAAVRAEMLANAGMGANYANRFDEAIAYYDASLACSRDAGIPPAPNALTNLGIAALESNRPAEAIERCEEALAAARAIDDRYWELFVLGNLSLAYTFGGDVERGRQAADDQLTGARRLGNRFMIANALLSSGIARVTSDPEVAIELLEESERTNPVVGNQAQTSFFRGIVHLRLRQTAEATRALQSALRFMQETGSGFFTATALSTVAGVLAPRRPDGVVEILGALDRFRVESGMEGAPNDVEMQRRTRARLEQAMDPAAFAAAWARGAELSIDDAAELAHTALGELDA